jgi:hypothetical protein
VSMRVVRMVYAKIPGAILLGLVIGLVLVPGVGQGQDHESRVVCAADGSPGGHHSGPKANLPGGGLSALTLLLLLLRTVNH